MRHSGLLALCAILTFAPLSAAEPLSREQALSLARNMSGSLSALRLLEEDAPLFESDSPVSMFRLGGQTHSMQLADGKSEFLGRYNFVLGLGVSWVKFLILTDTVQLSAIPFPSSSAGISSIGLAVPITPHRLFSVTPMVHGTTLQTGDLGLENLIVRARLAGVRAQLGFDEAERATVQTAFSPFELIGAFSGELGDTLLAMLGHPELRFARYAPGQTPYSLLPAFTPGEDNYGAQWDSADLLGDFGRLSVGGDVVPTKKGIDWRRVELGYGLGIALARNPEGGTVLSFNTQGFALRMDDQPRAGFVASARLTWLQAREPPEQTDRPEQSSCDVWSCAALLLTSNNGGSFGYFVELRVARNDFFSLRGVPLADATTVGLWFGNQSLDAGLARTVLVPHVREALDVLGLRRGAPKAAGLKHGVSREPERRQRLIQRPDDAGDGDTFF